MPNSDRAKVRRQIKQFDLSWQRIEKLYSEFAKIHGLTWMTLSILEEIYHANENGKSMTQKEISESLGLGKQLINGSIKYLLEQNYIEMKELPTDRRNKSIHLTPLGIEFSQKVYSQLDDILYDVWSGLTEEEAQFWLRLENKYADAFEKAISAKELPHSI